MLRRRVQAVNDLPKLNRLSRDENGIRASLEYFKYHISPQPHTYRSS